MDREMIQNLASKINTDVTYDIDNYFMYNSEYDIVTSIFYEAEDYIRFSDNPKAAVCEVAMQEAPKYMEELKKIPSLATMTDEEISMVSAWRLSLLLKHELDKKMASFQADRYHDSTEKVEYYGTKGRAANHGYDDYMKEHISFGNEYLDYVVNMYMESQEDTKKLQ